MRLTGSTAELRRLQRKLASWPSQMPRMSKVLGEQPVTLTLQGFREQRDPYGGAWTPNLRGGQILSATGRHLRRSFFRTIGRDLIEVGFSWRYAALHQYGATIRPKKAKLLRFRIGRNGPWCFAKFLLP